jgi:pimeloyl-ACP methyl ester carboxylesterase
LTNSFEGSVGIGSRSLYATVRGNGPVVVLSSGGGKPGVGNWGAIEPELSQFASVVAYDRAGLGRSDPAPEPPTAADMVSDLRALLRALGLQTPALLLGWSLSAVMVQLYASVYPADVVGLVLLDPTPDAMFAGFATHPRQLQDTIRQAMLKNAGHLGMSESGLREICHLPESCAQLSASAKSGVPDIPVVVVTAMKPPNVQNQPAKIDLAKASLAEAHKPIVARYKRGQQILAENSSHGTIVSDEPRLVLSAIRTILNSAATNT